MRSISPALMLFFLFLGNQGASAQTNYYVNFSYFVNHESKEADGYGQIDISPSGDVSGQICAFEDIDLNGQKRSSLGVVKVEGRKQQNMKLRFSVDQNADRRLKRILPTKPMKLSRDETGGTIGTLLPLSKMWRTPDNQANGEQSGVTLWDLPARFVPDAKYLSARLDDENRFDLSKFDGMSVDQAFNFMTTATWDIVITPSVVHVVYKPENRNAIADFVKQIDAHAYLVDPPLPACGNAFVEDIIRVPTLLEFYVARRLQTSGLAIAAYPEELPRSPPFAILALRSPSLTAKIRDTTRELDQRNDSLASFFDAELKSFLKEKRPKFSKPFEILRENLGVPGGYKAQVTGASISECHATGWEQFEIQILLTTYGDLSITLQAPSGYRAPGSLNTRPPDSRFKDNPLGDDRLSKIQDAFVDFLRRAGIADDKNASEPPSPEASCTL
jgi:hypothetical protein